MATDLSYADELPVSDIERRMGLPALASLLAERDTLVKSVADLRARHGAFGTYNDLRKIQLSTIASMIRAKALEANTKVTEGFIEEQAHAHPDYVAFVTTATEEKARWAVTENQIEAITETVMRGNVLARYLSAEIGLTPR